MANKVMILMHIVAYLFIIVANVVQIVYFTLARSRLRGFEISTICFLIVNSACSLIFGLLVNAIVNKIQEIKTDFESIAS